jgi:hypothetical protein
MVPQTDSVRHQPVRAHDCQDHGDDSKEPEQDDVLSKARELVVHLLLERWMRVTGLVGSTLRDNAAKGLGQPRRVVRAPDEKRETFEPVRDHARLDRPHLGEGLLALTDS